MPKILLRSEPGLRRVVSHPSRPRRRERPKWNSQTLNVPVADVAPGAPAQAAPRPPTLRPRMLAAAPRPAPPRPHRDRPRDPAGQRP
jgi:hypothetical protein